MDPILLSIISCIIGYLTGHCHAKIQNSTCLYGLCSISGLDVDVEAQTNKNPIAENINDKNIHII